MRGGRLCYCIPQKRWRFQQHSAQRRKAVGNYQGEDPRRGAGDCLHQLDTDGLAA